MNQPYPRLFTLKNNYYFHAEIIQQINNFLQINHKLKTANRKTESCKLKAVNFTAA
jgi:hypothetical protein